MIKWFICVGIRSAGRKTKLNHFSSDDEIVLKDTLQEDVHESFELPIYEFKQIIAATDNFSYRNKLGEGGFGPVYKVNLKSVNLTLGGLGNKRVSF